MNIKPCIPDLPSPVELKPYLERIHENHWYTNFGALVNEFEQEVIKLLKKNQPNCSIKGISCNSGTTALELTLSALNLNPNSYVLVPSLTYAASALAVLRCNLIPIICDVDPISWQLTPELAIYYTKHYQIAAVMPVCTFGKEAPIEQWDLFVEKTDIPVVVDAASAFGSQKIGKRCSVVFSFHATKTLAIGEGGGVFSEDESHIERCRQLSNFGMVNGITCHQGMNGKLSEFHAAVGLAQIKQWSARIKKIAKLHQTYNEMISNHSDQLFLPHETKNSYSMMKTIKTNINNQIIYAMLAKRGIETKNWYSPALHKQPLFKNKSKFTNLSTTKNLINKIVCLPFHLFLSDADVEYIIKNIAHIVSEESEGLLLHA